MKISPTVLEQAALSVAAQRLLGNLNAKQSHNKRKETHAS